MAQVHSGPKKSTQVQGVGVKMVGCPVRLYGIEVLSEEKRMLEIQWFEDVFDSLWDLGNRTHKIAHLSSDLYSIYNHTERQL